MPIPKIEFCNSWIYDQKWKEYYADSKVEYPPYEKLAGKIKRIEKAWQKNGDAILREIEKISGLKWQEKKIQCFVVGYCLPFSYPLTISLDNRYPIDYTVDVLTHELIHQILIQNDKRLDKTWNYFFREYKKEEFNTVIHIPVHAIHYSVFMKILGEKRLKREIDFTSKYSEYKCAWDIVLGEGAGNVMAEFKERIA